MATPYRWLRISPHRIQAWRNVNELPDRELMREGRWLVWRLGGHAAWPGRIGFTGRSEGAPDVLLVADQIEPAVADEDREGAPA